MPWRGRSLAVLGGLILIAFTAYLLLVPALENDMLALMRENAPRGNGIVLAGGATTTSDGYLVLGLKNASLLPITVQRMEPIGTPSDWRVVGLRLGSPTSGNDSVNSVTQPFAPQHLSPGEVVGVIVLYEPVPCDSSRLLDGVVSGPVDFRIAYTIFGLWRTTTFNQEGGMVQPPSGIGC
jgi:hypothetical protein